jgi:hypothetical protein
MASFSLVPINQVTLNQSAPSPGIQGSNVVSGVFRSHVTTYLVDGSGTLDVSLYTAPSGTGGGGSGVVYPTIGQLYPYY